MSRWCTPRRGLIGTGRISLRLKFDQSVCLTKCNSYFSGMSVFLKRISKTNSNTPMTSVTSARIMVSNHLSRCFFASPAILFILIQSIQQHGEHIEDIKIIFLGLLFFRCPIWLWFHHALWHWDFFIGSPNHGSPGLFVWSEVNTMISRSKLTIANRWVGAAFDGRHGSSIASPWDWELLKRIAARLCPAATSTNSRRPTSGGNQRRPRKQGRGKRHSIEWNISLQQL